MDLSTFGCQLLAQSCRTEIFRGWGRPRNWSEGRYHERVGAAEETASEGQSRRQLHPDGASPSFPSRAFCVTTVSESLCFVCVISHAISRLTRRRGAQRNDALFITPGGGSPAFVCVECRRRGVVRSHGHTLEPAELGSHDQRCCAGSHPGKRPLRVFLPSLYWLRTNAPYVWRRIINLLCRQVTPVVLPSHTPRTLHHSDLETGTRGMQVLPLPKLIRASRKHI